MTEKEIRLLTPKDKRYKVYIGGNIFIEIMPTGKKFFRLKRGNTTKTLGESPNISLKEARIYSLSVLEDFKKPVNNERLFSVVFDEWLERANWSESTLNKNLSRINRYVLPPFQNRNIADIKRVEIIEELRKIELKGNAETTKKVLGIIKQVLEYSLICGYIEINPALGLSSVIKKQKNKPMAAFTKESDIQRLVQAIDLYDRLAVKSLMQFTMYTLCRPSECRLAKWDEIDGDVWIIPAERMKLRKEHIVPLSKQSLTIIETMKDFRDSDYIFPSTRPKRPLSDNALLVALRIMGFDKEETTIHGFRSMGSTVLNEKGYRPDVIEKALAHAGEDKIRAIYNRAEYMEERKQMLQDYADYLDSLL